MDRFVADSEGRAIEADREFAAVREVEMSGELAPWRLSEMAEHPTDGRNSNATLPRLSEHYRSDDEIVIAIL